MSCDALTACRGCVPLLFQWTLEIDTSSPMILQWETGIHTWWIIYINPATTKPKLFCTISSLASPDWKHKHILQGHRNVCLAVRSKAKFSLFRPPYTSKDVQGSEEVFIGLTVIDQLELFRYRTRKTVLPILCVKKPAARTPKSWLQQHNYAIWFL